MFLLQGFLQASERYWHSATCFAFPSSSQVAFRQKHRILSWPCFSRMGLAKAHHESVQGPRWDLGQIKRYCLRLMMGSFFKANKSQKLINMKYIPPCEVDASFFNIMFHSLDAGGPQSFQFLLSPCPSQKCFFFFLLSLPGAWKGFLLLWLETVTGF